MHRRQYTIIQNNLCLQSKSKSQKMLKPQFAEHEPTRCNTQKYLGGKRSNKSKFIRFSGQLFKCQQQKKGKKTKNLEQLLEWHKIFTGPKSKNNSLKTQQIISELSLLKPTQQSNPAAKMPKRMHHRIQTQPSLYFGSRKKPRNRTAEIPMDRIKYSKCAYLVDDIYRKIALLKEIGYSDYQIDNWMLAFCEERKPFFKQIFMKNVNYSVYSQKEEYQYEKSVKAVKERLRFQLLKSKDVYTYVQMEQLNQLCIYFQEIVVQKNMKKAKEVEQSIIEKLSFDMLSSIKNEFCVFTKKEPTEVYNFLQELAPFQEKFGNFHSFSKINKQRFLELTKVEKKLKNFYKDMVQTQKKKVEKVKIQKQLICNS